MAGKAKKSEEPVTLEVTLMAGFELGFDGAIAALQGLEEEGIVEEGASERLIDMRASVVRVARETCKESFKKHMERDTT